MAAASAAECLVNYRDLETIPDWQEKLTHECAICLLPLLLPTPLPTYKPGVADVLLCWPKACGHLFHHKCFEDWVRPSATGECPATTCPLCRAPTPKTQAPRPPFSWQWLDWQWHPANGKDPHLHPRVMTYMHRFGTVSERLAWQHLLAQEKTERTQAVIPASAD